MVAQLIRRHVDICGTSLTVTAERDKVIDFGVGLTEDSNSVFLVTEHISGSSRREINLMVYLSIFSYMAWLGIFSLATLFAIQYSLLGHFEKIGPNGRSVGVRFMIGLQYFALHLMQRANTLAPTGFAFKSYILVCSIVTFFLYVLYTGDLTAAMTVGTQASTRSGERRGGQEGCGGCGSRGWARGSEKKDRGGTHAWHTARQ